MWTQTDISALRLLGLSPQDNGLTEKFKKITFSAGCLCRSGCGFFPFHPPPLPPFHFSLIWLLSQLAFVVTAYAKTDKNNSSELYPQAGRVGSCRQAQYRSFSKMPAKVFQGKAVSGEGLNQVPGECMPSVRPSGAQQWLRGFLS